MEDSIIGEVVGRNDLCHVIIEGLRHPATRRPHVVIGGVATGKTALLVQLTKLLAERGAVPVPVRLRDAQQELDFRKLARTRFLAQAEALLQSDAEGEIVWRQLSREDMIVVLADGLEQALIEGDAVWDRDNLIRFAIYQANEQRLPLVITSRPHDPLRWMEAAIIEMEPMSEEAAVGYIQHHGPRENERRLDWIVQAADMAETPLYLEITRELHREELLKDVLPSREDGHPGTPSIDRTALRLRLLDTWMNALIHGHFRTRLALSWQTRAATVEQLSALACIGLKQDRLYVKFDELAPPKIEHGPYPMLHDRTLREELGRRLELIGRPFDIRLAAIRGAQLGLVEAQGDGVRFPRSIMQAYLGSRLIDAAMADNQYREAALRDSGRELLTALVMRSRAAEGVAADGPTAAETTPRRADVGQWRDALCEAAATRADIRALDLYAAALEIDAVCKAPALDTIAAELAVRWPEMRARDLRTLEEAKLNLIRRFGAAARVVASKRRNVPGDRTKQAYAQLLTIGRSEPSFPLRRAAAQAIGDGGDAAFDALRETLRPTDDLWMEWTGRRSDELTTAERHEPTRPVGEQVVEENRNWRQQVMHLWLAPLLVGSASERSQEAQASLEDWVRLVGRDPEGRPGGLPISLEVALAQGFKDAANRRRRHPYNRPEAQAYLAEQAREMLKGARFWFSRLTLVHALCMWSLPDEPDTRRSSRVRGARSKTLVDYWAAAIPDARPEHPFVVQAYKLAMWALETGQPERFIWIDESSIIGRAGSRPANSDVRRTHNLWIPPSTGWTALHPRAQQLLADVLLLLVLADRGERPADRDRRLERTNRLNLPPCLAGDRSPLDPTRTVEMAPASSPGSNCKDGCPFQLCPYPPKGAVHYRVELSEVFCRRQRALLNEGLVRQRAAPWQEVRPGSLRRFWTQMAQRARPS